MTAPTQAPAMPWISDRMNRLVTCLCEALADRGAGPTCWCGIYPGEQVSWEYCGDCGHDRCGMGWVRLDSVFGSSAFPEPDADATCRRPLAYTLQVGVTRCMPLMDADGALPDEIAITASAYEQVADMLAARYAIDCCFSSSTGQHVLQGWEPAGPAGGCVGGAWTVTVAA